MSAYSSIKQISNENSTFRSLYCQNEQQCLEQTIDSINHVLASPIAVFISFITTGNDSARVIACLIHRDNHLIKYGKLSLISLFGKVYVF